MQQNYIRLEIRVKFSQGLLFEGGNKKIFINLDHDMLSKCVIISCNLYKKKKKSDCDNSKLINDEKEKKKKLICMNESLFYTQKLAQHYKSLIYFYTLIKDKGKKTHLISKRGKKTERTGETNEKSKISY